VLVPLDDEPQVLAVIPTLGKDLARLRRCVEALRAQTSTARVSVVIVLNTHEEPTIDRSIASDCTILRPGLNLGWAGGLQLGRASSPTATHLWLVQDDMTPEPGCLAALESELQLDPRLAVVSPLVIDNSGMVPTASCGGVLRRVPLIEMDHWYPAHPTAPDDLTGLDELDYVPSRGMLVDTAAWDLFGGMYPGYYPVIWADVDLCTGLKEAGRSFGIALRARTRHDGRGSTPSPFGQLLYERNRDLYRARWGPDRDRARPSRTPVPSDLEGVVASAAASLAADLATRYSDLVRENEHSRAQARATAEEIRELRASTSWRITRPVRLLGRWVKSRR
jgi:GT2 family glycosyltransferase